MERLQKVIAASGYCSRRKAEELITQGKVIVNGEVVKELGTKVNSSDIIVVEGHSISYEEKEYYMLNKPREVISSASDDKGRRTVVDYIDTDKRIYPIGRLDYDTTGALLLTNDGEFANILTHPKNNIDKVYVAKIEGIINSVDAKKIERGVLIDGYKTSKSKDIIIMAKDKKIKELEEENKKLKEQLEVLRGKLYEKM